ncbi:UNVERIFIED_CONTAM: hypothetical protein FKN15_045472 [Acipenser sinensis]
MQPSQSYSVGGQRSLQASPQVPGQMTGVTGARWPLPNQNQSAVTGEWPHLWLLAETLTLSLPHTFPRVRSTHGLHGHLPGCGDPGSEKAASSEHVVSKDKAGSTNVDSDAGHPGSGTAASCRHSISGRRLGLQIVKVQRLVCVSRAFGGEDKPLIQYLVYDSLKAFFVSRGVCDKKPSRRRECGRCYYQTIVTPVIEQILPDSPCSRIPHTVTLVSIPASTDGKRGISVSIDEGCSSNGCGADHTHTVRVKELDTECISPDVKNSIHVGDRILEINGTPIRNVSPDEIDLLIQETSRLLQLTIEHDPHGSGSEEEVDGASPLSDLCSPLRPLPRTPCADTSGIRSRVITRSCSIDKSPCSSNTASPHSHRKDIGRSESLRVVTTQTHRIFRPSDLIHGEVLGKGCFGQAIKPSCNKKIVKLDLRVELEDFLSDLEDQSWCIACGEFGHKVVCCPFQEKRKRRSGRLKKKERASPEEGEEASASSRDPAAAAVGRVSRVLCLC